MDNTLLEREQSILDMKAWRGVFQERADAGDGEAIVIKEPRDLRQRQMRAHLPNPVVKIAREIVTGG